MLVSELITWMNAIYEPDETSSFEISDTRWILFLNEAVNEIRPHTQISVTATTNIVAGTEEYAIPTDADVLYDLYRLADSEDDIYSEMNKMLPETVLGHYEYTLWDRTFKIADPEVSETNGLKLYYYKKLSDFTATTETIELDDPYILGYYALSRVELADRQTNEFSIHYAEYEKRLENLKGKLGYDTYQCESEGDYYGYPKDRQF